MGAKGLEWMLQVDNNGGKQVGDTNDPIGSYLAVAVFVLKEGLEWMERKTCLQSFEMEARKR